MTEPIPPDATSIFLYSPRHQRMRDEGRMARLSYVAADGTKTAYTREIILAQPDAEAQIGGYEKQFPDAAIIGTALAIRRSLPRQSLSNGMQSGPRIGI